MSAFATTAARSEDPARSDRRSIDRGSVAWGPESSPGREIVRNSRERLQGILGRAAPDLVGKTDPAAKTDWTDRS